MASDLEQRLTTAVAVARNAGEVALSAYRRPRVRAFKGAQDYVLESDAEVERAIRTGLLEAFPHDSFFGEEGGGDFGRDVWVVDPIDGTSNFARGIAHWCISIAFVRDGRTEIGVIYQPVADEMYAARRGAGATRNGQAIRVSGLADMNQAAIEAGWSSRRTTEAYIAAVAHLYGVGAEVRRHGSGALGLAHTADGRIDGYGELHMNSWDALAGLLLVEEAGGWAHPFLEPGGSGLRDGNLVLGCTPALKEIVAEAFGVPLHR